MCCWAAYIGKPLFLANIIADPVHFPIEQSWHAEESKTNLNADGFGAAWHAHRNQPGLYRDIYPE